MPAVVLSPEVAAKFAPNIRLIATDMDGTLTQQGKFTPALLAALEQLAKADIKILIVTGRSAGWVSGLASYLPIWGAIAENGGLLFRSDREFPIPLTPIPNIASHRQRLTHMFEALQTQFPHIEESGDNRFRITDWTFDVSGLTPNNLEVMANLCQQQGLGFTYSTVQCHIKPLMQEKAAAVWQVLRDDFPLYAPDRVLTVGDSPNDESLFDPSYFPHSVGVANVLEYCDRLTHQPAYVTQGAESEGFCELVQYLT